MKNAAQNVASRSAVGLLAAALALMLALIMPAPVWAASGDIASGTSGTCDWVIDSDGELTIGPSSGTSGTLASCEDFGDASWNSYRSKIVSVCIEEGVSTGDAACGLFYSCSNLTSIEGLDNLDVSETTDLSGMFYYCESLTSLDLSSWDISSAETISSMFYHCSALESLDVSTWDVSDVTTMSGVFGYCSSLEVLDLSSWDTSSATSMGLMFILCTGLVLVSLGSKFSFTGAGKTSCELPTPVDDDGTEGVWMNESTGVTYDDPADIPSNTAATYVAVFNGVVATPSTGTGSDSGSSSSGSSSSTRTYFTDVPASDSSKYYFDAVYAMADAGYVTGYSDGSFGVGDGMTREAFVTVLWRMAGEPEASTDAGFSDVRSSGYYAEAVNWAAENDIVAGYSNGEFGVGDAMTFEQMTTIVARYAAGGDSVLNEAMTDAQAAEVLAQFADGSKVSSWADNGMAYLVEEGLVNGNARSDGTLALSPSSTVARERAVTVLSRAVEAGIL